MEQGGYYLGLDIGTESVGWAVTDESYHIQKRKGKALWGVRLFDGAQTAQERRSYRVGRRRIERRRARLDWLQQVFAQPVGQVDPAFFQRLQESKFREEDKQGDYPLGRYTLFADKNYCDADYYKEYPTIYHLRKTLMEQDGPFDVRLVYLAVHHIMKYRGHFLYDDMSVQEDSLESGLERLRQAVESLWEKPLVWKDAGEVEKILCARSSATQKAKLLAEQFEPYPKGDGRGSLLKLLAGSKNIKLKDLYGDDALADAEPESISLADEFESHAEALAALLGDDIELLLAAKQIYDRVLLLQMLNGYTYPSHAKVAEYEKHAQDLRLLKDAVRQMQNPQLYREVFHIAKDKHNNYPAYAGKGNAHHRCSYEEFAKYLKGVFKNSQEESPQIQQILQQLEQGTFLPLQTNKNNGVISHQLHQAELELILERAQRYLPFLAQKDESGLTKAQQIVEMFRFKIPYYVGPLNSNSPHSWVVRTPEKIYPWNFAQVVDLEQCREQFIQRMTAKCSYLGEDILPKDSLLYTSFMVLNELNNLKVNGHPISVQQKQMLYNQVCLSGYKITQTKLRNALQLQQQDQLTGLDGPLKATLAPWKHYQWLIQRPGGIAMAEDIIRRITLFGQDKKLLAQWLQKTYGHLLSSEERTQALAFKASGWGKLSKTFLTGIFHQDEQTGNRYSMMEMLWNTGDNLMQLLSSRYTFGQAVEEYRKQKFASQAMTLEDYLKESYASPGIKRAIHQTLSIVAEVEKIMKSKPKRVFVEMAREEGEKGKRTVSRKAELQALYKSCKMQNEQLFLQLEQQQEQDLRRDKLYLYYIQLGRCMYSGEVIDLSRLDSDYDIDHIYPQSKTKDDSLNNRVLVKRTLNANKSDSYPISPDIRQAMTPFWAQLHQKGMIGRAKWERLTRSTPFTPEEQAGFIARQLVETRQSSKIVAELLQRRFGESTEIVYVKAGNVSSFRQDQRITLDGRQLQAGQCKNQHTQQDPLFVKCRSINDFHHAKDAYLNIVVGNVYHVKFTRNPLCFLKQEQARYSLNRMFDFDVCRGKEQAWTAGEQGSIAVVRHTMGKNNILFSRRAAPASGQLFDQNPVAKGKGENKTPLKSSDPRLVFEKYGGYNKLSTAYFILVEHTNKKKRVRSLEPVLLMHKSFYQNNPESYCTQFLRLNNPVVLVDEIPINALLELDGFRMHLSGRTGKQVIFKNANPLILAPSWHQYVKSMEKYLERCAKAKKDLEISLYDGLTAEQNQQLYELLLQKLENPRYCVKLETAAKTLREQQQKFQTLSAANQCRILVQVLNLFANNASSADLKLLNGKAGIGILLLSKNLSNVKDQSFKLICQSVTGFYEREIDLMAEVVQ